MTQTDESTNVDLKVAETDELTKREEKKLEEEEEEEKKKPPASEALVTAVDDAEDYDRETVDACASRRTSQSSRFKLLVSDNNKRLNRAIRPIKAYLYGVCFALSMCMASVFIKMAPTLDGANHSAVRYTIQSIVMVFFIRRSNFEFLGPRNQRKLLVLRGVVGSAAVILSYFSIKYLDVSDVETLTNSSVIITALFSRIFLNEKLRLVHVISLSLTITGVVFIVRPSFLFGIEQDLESFFHVQLTTMHNNGTSLAKSMNMINNSQVGNYKVEIKDHSNRDLFESIFGVSFALLSAVCMSIAQVSIRKLCLGKVHFSITSLYPAMVGLPASVLISALLIKTKSSHENLANEMDVLWLQIVYSVCAGIFGTIGIIFLNRALKHEDATKIGILKTSGVLLSFILQYFFLDITVDFLGILGAICVISATISIMLVKLFEIQISKCHNPIVRFFMFQF